MSDEINEAEVRDTCDVARRMHETNEAKRTEYRMDPGLAAASLTWALAALDAERKAHKETRRERGWQAERHMEALTDIAALLYERNADARAEKAERVERDLGTSETVLAHVRAALSGAENELRTVRALAESRLRDIDTLCADRAAWTERAEKAEREIVDVRQRCGGYPDSRVDGDGGIVAVVVRERDDAQAAVVVLRESASALLRGPDMTVTAQAWRRLEETIAGAPMTLACQVRARVLREALSSVLRIADEYGHLPGECEVADAVRALADEAEREKRLSP